MKIALIFPNSQKSFTGIEFYIVNLANAIRVLSSNSSFVALSEVPLKDRLVNADNLVIRNKFTYFKTYRWFNELPLLLRENSFDLIHNPGQIPMIRKFKQKMVLTIHDLSVLKHWRDHPFSRVLFSYIFLGKTILDSIKVIVDSENTKRDIIDRYHIPISKIKVIPLAADSKYIILPPNVIAKTIFKHHIPKDYILYVGTLEPRKNIPTLIKAYSKIKDKVPHKLVITGKKGWKYEEIFSTVKNLKLEKDVIFTGYVPEDDLPALYNGASLFVYPSFYEGFGLPPLEAMQCGCPVITSNTSSLPEVVGDAGIMVDPHNVNELADAILRVLKDKKLQKEMREKGLKQAKKFSWEKCAKETLKVYEEVLHE